MDNTIIKKDGLKLTYYRGHVIETVSAHVGICDVLIDGKLAIENVIGEERAIMLAKQNIED